VAFETSVLQDGGDLIAKVPIQSLPVGLLIGLLGQKDRRLPAESKKEQKRDQDAASSCKHGSGTDCRREE
jgi:hypothetical protein